MQCLSKRLFATIPLVLALSLSSGVLRAQTLDCPEQYQFDVSVDYLDPSAQKRIQGIEAHHFNADVENLVRGVSMAGVGGELAFVLNWVPNHHRALQALLRLALREKSEKPFQTDPYTVTCWMHRATVFAPKDGKVFLILGVYLARVGKLKEAVVQLEEADRLLVSDANVHYNLGLVLFDLKDFDRALEYAKRAYAGGFPLPGLRQKLMRAGAWRD